MPIKKVAVIFYLGSVKMIYHYTTFEGFKGIVENQALWFSDIRFLNDYREVQHGKDWLTKTYEITCDDCSEVRKSKFLRAVVENIIESELTVFACCFSSHPDILSQWRGYAGGSGIAVGIDTNIFEAYVEAKLTRIEYNQDVLIKTFERVIKEIALNESLNTNKEVAKSKLLLPIFASKNNAFSEEQEIRCILPVDAAYTNPRVREPKIRYRTKSSILVPYIEIDLKAVFKDVIKEIWVGPSVYGKLAWKSVKEFSDYHGLRNATVIESSAPYRT